MNRYANASPDLARAHRATYLNPWHDPRVIDSKPIFTTDVKPTEYRGLLIFHRLPGSFEVVKAGVCLTQRAGMSGACRAIDLLLDEPGHWEAERMAEYLALAVPA